VRSPNCTSGTQENQEWAKKSWSVRNEDQADALLSRAGKENYNIDPARKSNRLVGKENP
jgi:hypothetical protein